MKTPEQWAEDFLGEKVNIINNSDLVAAFAQAQSEARADQHTKTWEIALQASAHAPLDKTGREYVPGSLWENMAKQFAATVLRLPLPPLEQHDKAEG